MTIEELRHKHPKETKDWTDKQCQEYCRSLEAFTNIFLEYVAKKLSGKSVPFKLPLDHHEEKRQ